MTNDTITLGWDPTDAIQYKVIWGDSGSGPQQARFTIESSIILINLKPGELYLMFVKGCAEDRNCNSSTTAVSAVTGL